jgi:hypothetical protein
MLDEPPPIAAAASPTTKEVEPHLPTEMREDGSQLIDLTPLAPVPEECMDEEEPNPFNPEIIVCRLTQPSPRLDKGAYGPSADELLAGSAVPRARVRLSEDAELEANVLNQGVGGFNANGGEVRVKIDF